MMDSRNKILTLQQARDIDDAIAFVTHMEVLRASHLQMLEAAVAANPGRLVVVLTDPDVPLVPLQARAELAAALRVVDYVVPAPEGPGPVLDSLRPKAVVNDEEEDRGRTRLLMEHVRSRARV
jgi:hypothetical protein